MNALYVILRECYNFVYILHLLISDFFSESEKLINDYGGVE
jgi:hypothetical protein